MISEDLLLIICVIILGLATLNLLGDPRFKEEGFANQNSYSFIDPKMGNPELLSTNENQPYHLYDSEIDNTRPYNVLGTLTQQKCYEQDGHRLPEKLQDYSQRTNNYVHTYPDSCSAPFKELVGSFYAPREGAIGTPIPMGNKYPASTYSTGSCE